MNNIYLRLSSIIILIPLISAQNIIEIENFKNNLNGCIEDSFGDCCDVPFEVWYDNDNDGLGDPNFPALACLDYVGWVTNDSDLNDNCFSNELDCADNCDGTWVEDQFGMCCSELQTFWQDLDGDGLGNPNISMEACDEPEGWSSFPVDLMDNCFSNIKDCLGICDGTAYYDACGICDDNSENDNTSCVGCMDEAAINFDPDALIDSGNCIYPSDHIWHVSVLGSDEFGFGTVEDPYFTIQHTIDSASNLDTILVHSGIFYENINLNGKNLLICSLYAFTLEEHFIYETIIDGGYNDTVILIENGESDLTYIIGFTIQHGAGSGISNSSVKGGGITIKNHSNPNISHLDIKENTSIKGGGIVILESNPSLENLSIYENMLFGDISNNFGGGLFCKLSDPIISHVSIFNNETDRTGGGIYFRLSNANLSHSLIYNNVAHHRAGGIDFSSSTVTVNKVTMSGNHADNGGGGFQTYYSESYPIILNSFIWGNTPNQLIAGSGGQFDLHYSAIEDSWNQGVGNIYEDPLFVNSYGGDFSLTESSPCIDSGTNYFESELIYFNMNSEDYYGYQPDMGAFESEYSNYLVGDVNYDNDVNILDIIIIVGFILNEIDLTDIEMWLSDLNQDGEINILDIIIMINIITGN